VSTAQLVAGLVGQAVAVRRQRSFDTPVPFLRGDPAHVGRDSWWAGTSLSAPVYMLAGQAWATARLARREDDAARRALRVLGTVMVPGCLAERLCRERLTPAGLDPVESPIVIAGLVGSGAMVVLGRPGR